MGYVTSAENDLRQILETLQRIERLLRASTVYGLLDPANPCNRADICTMSQRCAQYQETCARVGGDVRPG